MEKKPNDLFQNFFMSLGYLYSSMKDLMATIFGQTTEVKPEVKSPAKGTDSQDDIVKQGKAFFFILLFIVAVAYLNSLGKAIRMKFLMASS